MNSTALVSPGPSASILPTVATRTASLYFFALLTFILRIYVRRRNLGWDDYAMSIAMCLATGTWATTIALFSVTGGRHMYYISVPTLVTAGKLAFAIVPLSSWGITMVKVSVALMLLRIKQTKLWKFGNWFLIGVLVAVAVGSTSTQMMQCRPLAANWNALLRKPDQCWKIEAQLAVTFTVSALFAATDLACALLPLAFLTKLNRPMRERLVLAVLMAMGLFATACGIVKAALLKNALKSTDRIWDGASINIWLNAEILVGIIAANIPCLKAFLERMFCALGGNAKTTPSAEYGSGYVGGYSGRKWSEDDRRQYYELPAKPFTAYRTY